MKRTSLWIGAVVSLAVAAATRADDGVFYRLPLDILKITEGSWPKDKGSGPAHWEMYELLSPYAVIDGGGEAYVTVRDRDDERSYRPQRWSLDNSVLLVGRTGAGPLSGWVFVPKSDWSGFERVRFSEPEAAPSPQAGADFYAAKEAHYDRLQSAGIPGAAWFRRQATEAHRAGPTAGAQSRLPQRIPSRPPSDIADTYQLFIGGRALSENLQLARDLPPPPATPPPKNSPPPAPDEPPVPVSSIEGITVAAMDFGDLLGDRKPVLDALAAVIPANQHALFFPSFDALMAMADETTEQGLPIFRGALAHSEDGRIMERYQRQLGLKPTALARILGPAVVRSVAITGSDSYFPTGTDVAVLFQASDTKALLELITAQVRANVAGAADAAWTTETIGDTRCAVVATPDRSVCAHIAAIGDAVVVANSTEQIRRLALVQTSRQETIDALPEYRFFRTRYPAGAQGETAFLFISDATIRRWCGPQWRIGASRRLRAAAIMADVTAAHMAELVAGVGQARPVQSDTPMRTIGELTLGPGGVRSSVHGSPAFLTPIVELGITDVAPDEADAYKRWRGTYQRNWSWALDPIAISFGIAPDHVSADLTITPLIIGTAYRSWLDFAQGAAIGPDAGDPHDAIAHAAVAINIESGAAKAASGAARTFVPNLDIEPLGWLGQSVSLYADPDPFWGQMLGAPDTGAFLEKNAPHLPVGLYAEVGSALKLTAFLTAVRGFVDQAAPGMTAWETGTYHDQPYVRAGLTEKARAEGGGGAFDSVSMFYAATPRALIVSLSEDVLKRAIDRQAARASSQGKPPAPHRPWLGSGLCFQFTRQGLELLGGSGDSEMRRSLRRASWSNLPILNEWKRLYPDRDPVLVHQAFWGVRLLDPAGGEYRWNEDFKTLESTTYGHPGRPKPGPDDLGPLESITSGNAGVTFQDKGLRARAEIERRPGKR